MASVQYERKEELTQLSNEEKVTLDELIKQAESEDIEAQALAVVAENEGLDKDANPNLLLQIYAVAGALKNQTKGPLSVFKTHKWAGHIVKNYPNPLNSLGAFGLSAIQSKGIKAAVVYSGKNKADVECAWLLAFVNNKALGRKIYAECGRKSKFDNINWAQIEQKLNKAGSGTNASDKETGTGVHATIQGTSGKALVAAAYTG